MIPPPAPLSNQDAAAEKGDCTAPSPTLALRGTVPVFPPLAPLRLDGSRYVEDVDADTTLHCGPNCGQDKPDRCPPGNREGSFRNCEEYNADCGSDGSGQRNPQDSRQSSKANNRRSSRQDSNPHSGQNCRQDGAENSPENSIAGSRRNSCAGSSAGYLGDNPPGGGVDLAQYHSSCSFAVAYRHRPRFILSHRAVEFARSDPIPGVHVIAVLAVRLELWVFGSFLPQTG